MEKNIYLEIEYLGTNYFGFQLQNKKGKRQVTVQQVLESSLKRLFRKKIRITYASRTDRGVHAKAQAVNFKIDTKIVLKNIKRALNTFLPSDIRVKKVKRVPLDFHARFWARQKLYRYIILNKKESSVFWKDFAWHIDESLNLQKMKMAGKKLIGRKDFSLFAKHPKEYKDCVRTINNITLKAKEGFIYIDIEADGFLRNMARNIVSFLTRIAGNKIEFKDIRSIFAKKISYINKPAPACGLYLYRVNYSNL